MSADEFLEVLLAKPFIPFRVFMSGVATFDVRHPDQCAVGRTVFRVMVPESSRLSQAGKTMVCSLRHIVYLEPLQVSS